MSTKDGAGVSPLQDQLLSQSEYEAHGQWVWPQAVSIKYTNTRYVVANLFRKRTGKEVDYGLSPDSILFVLLQQAHSAY